MTNNKLQILCQRIISGGQTGVDRGVLDACLSKKYSCGGWCPKGRLAEDGIINLKYPLKETNDRKYITRTRKNIIDSDGTLIISPKKLRGGTLLTYQIAGELNKPVLIISPKNRSYKNIIADINYWLQNQTISILNVAGPRKSEWDAGYALSFKIISLLIDEFHKSNLHQNNNPIS